MTASDVTPFRCPHCAAAYKLVHAEAEPTASEPELTCLRCDGPLPGREGGFIRKYFFVDRETQGSTEFRARNRHTAHRLHAQRAKA